MTTYDETFIYGVLAGILVSAFGLLGLLIIHDETRLADTKDAPFEPTRDSSLRLMTVCGSCRCYIGPDRKISSGQHLSMLSGLCPRCAKRQALARVPPATT